MGGDGELVLLCVPDSSIAEVAGRLEHGPWVAHVSGRHAPVGTRPASTPLLDAPAADVHARARARAARRGLGGGHCGSGTRRRAAGFWLAETLGLKPFELADDARPLYHAGAAIASNYLVTLHAVASELFRAAGAPPEALVPLMRRTIDNGFELTGPIERGDWETVEAHRRAIRAARPELEPLYDVLAEATAK